MLCPTSTHGQAVRANHVRQIVRHRGDIGIAVIGASAESGEIEGEAGPVGQVAANQIPLGGTGSKCMYKN